MAGTIEGGKKAQKTISEKYGKDFYARIGSMGGKKGTTGGFYNSKCEGCEYSSSEHKKAECAGARGGRISRRTKKI